MIPEVAEGSQHCALPRKQPLSENEIEEYSHHELGRRNRGTPTIPCASRSKLLFAGLCPATDGGRGCRTSSICTVSKGSLLVRLHHLRDSVLVQSSVPSSLTPLISRFPVHLPGDSLRRCSSPTLPLTPLNEIEFNTTPASPGVDNRWYFQSYSRNLAVGGLKSWEGQEVFKVSTAVWDIRQPTGVQAVESLSFQLRVCMST